VERKNSKNPATGLYFAQQTRLPTSGPAYLPADPPTFKQTRWNSVAELLTQPSSCKPAEICSRPTKLGSRPAKLGSKPAKLGSGPTNFCSRPAWFESGPANFCSRSTGICSEPAEMRSRAADVLQQHMLYVLSGPFGDQQKAKYNTWRLLWSLICLIIVATITSIARLDELAARFLCNTL